MKAFVTKTDWKDTDSSVRVGNQISAQQESFKNPVSGDRSEVHVALPAGFIFKDAKATNTKRQSVSIDGLEFSDENTSGF